MLNIKRAYEEAASSDGTRVLVDRVWPRGVSKEKARIDWWAKELAPSAELRKWFGHDPEKFHEFAVRYRRELEGNDAMPKLEGLLQDGDLTLVYGAKDEEHNQAVVLKELLAGKDGAGRIPSGWRRCHRSRRVPYGSPVWRGSRRLHPRARDQGPPRG